MQRVRGSVLRDDRLCEVIAVPREGECRYTLYMSRDVP